MGLSSLMGLRLRKMGRRLICEFSHPLSMRRRLLTSFDTTQFGYRSFGCNAGLAGPCHAVSISHCLLGSTFSNKSNIYHSYAFDVDPVTHVFKNRRVLAYSDCGIPDGIEVDTNGNVYAGTGDGVQVRIITACLPIHSLFYLVLFTH
jgi:hypothetical protein